MKKETLFLFVFFCFYLMHGNQIKVCDSCEVSSIKEAIALSKDGDEILIMPGIYKEHGIVVNKSIHIKGVDYPVIDGEFKETIFKVTADHFSIKGLEVINVGQSYTKDYAAILVSESDDFVIENNRI